ncbi:MAG: CopL family metal-binding regulatory protein [Pseudoxanthomonas sp.]
MPTFSTMLRIFLCVCLALNGTGAFAMSAHAHTVSGHVDVAAHAAHDRPMLAPMASAMGETQQSASHHGVSHEGMDCCAGDHATGHDTGAPASGKGCDNSAGCHCPCSQHMAMVVSHFMPAPRSGVSTSHGLRSVDRDAPPVLRLIRPPIA